MNSTNIQKKVSNRKQNAERSAACSEQERRTFCKTFKRGIQKVLQYVLKRNAEHCADSLPSEAGFHTWTSNASEIDHKQLFHTNLWGTCRRSRPFADAAVRTTLSSIMYVCV